MTKKEKINTKTDHELSTLVSETRAKLRTHRFSAAGARAKDPSESRKLRVTIARVLTEQRQRGQTTVAPVPTI